jgi:hypothetical protein
MPSEQRRKMIKDAAAKVKQYAVSPEFDNHPASLPAILGAIDLDTIGKEVKPKQEQKEVAQLQFDLQTAAWDMVLALSEARREMGMDFPDELTASYEACSKLEEVLLVLKKEDS